MYRLHCVKCFYIQVYWKKRVQNSGHENIISKIAGGVILEQKNGGRVASNESWLKIEVTFKRIACG